MCLGRIRLFLGWLLLGSILGIPAGTVLAADRAPNIILIVADDLGWGDVGFNGRAEWKTPHVDRLAADGVVLKRCYSAAPICGPSRGALLTGKYTIHTGVRRNDQDLPLEEVTIAEALKHRGYKSGLFGKWQHGKPRSGRDHYVHPMDQGFDDFFGFTDSYEALEKFPTQLWRGRERVPVSGYVDDLITDHAIEFLSHHNDTPFFLDVSYLAPHFSIAAPTEEIERLKGRVSEVDPLHPLNTTYAAMITRMDRNIGRLLAALERLHLIEDTLLVFTSDNGATFEFGNQGTSAALDSNRPLRGQKRTLWEGGIRVPGLVYWPAKIHAGGVCQENVHLTDLFPTLVAAAGGTLDAAWHIDGVNLLPFWTGRGHAPERTLFWEWQSEGADQLAALRGDFKLVITRGGKPELYDVSGDPSERRDLSATHPLQIYQLQSELDAWIATEDLRGRE
jgi:arylsulfatase A